MFPSEHKAYWLVFAVRNELSCVGTAIVESDDVTDVVAEAISSLQHRRGRKKSRNAPTLTA